MSNSDSANQVFKLLESPAGQQSLLIRRAKMLGKINTAFAKLLPKFSQNRLIIMNIKEDSVIIGADSATQLTHLRYDHQNLLASMKQIPGLEGITQLHFKVQPTAFSTRENPTRRAFMSEQTSHVLKQSAESFEDPELRSALLRLSKNNTSTS